MNNEVEYLMELVRRNDIIISEKNRTINQMTACIIVLLLSITGIVFGVK